MTAATDSADADREHLRTLLTATAGGDRKAFEHLYQRTSAKLFGICLRILGERTQAEEALQDVYLTIWRKAGMYDGDRASPITWLAQIARNKAIDHLRASKPERLSQPIDLVGELSDDGPGAPSWPRHGTTAAACSGASRSCRQTSARSSIPPSSRAVPTRRSRRAAIPHWAP